MCLEEDGLVSETAGIFNTIGRRAPSHGDRLLFRVCAWEGHTNQWRKFPALPQASHRWKSELAGGILS